MVISTKNQVALIIFISTLSALLPGISNNPLAILPCLVILFVRYTSDSVNINLKRTFLKSWIIFFCILFLLSTINFILIGNSFNIFESIFLSFTYIIYLLTFNLFEYEDLRDGIIKGSFPMLSFILFFELPLKLINPNFLIIIRENLNLRAINLNTLLGFFEEASQVPSLFLLVVTIVISIPLILSTLSKFTSGKIICSLIPNE